MGHSLGGGVAALLTLLLKPVYPGVKALAVSPPGGLVSEGACREVCRRVGVAFGGGVALGLCLFQSAC